MKLRTYIAHSLVLISLITAVGCTSLKEATGKYVADAVKDKVVADIDDLLDKRGLSIQEIKGVTDLNNDGSLNGPEILETTKAATRDYVLLEARSLIEAKIKEADARIAETEERLRQSHETHTSTKFGEFKGTLENKANELWKWILGLIAAYLTKQIYSAKQDGKRDARIQVLEKVAGRDLDGDGKIGGIPISLEPQSKPQPNSDTKNNVC